MRTCIIVFLLSLFVACSSNSVPGNILPIGTMHNIVKDLIQVDEYINNSLVKDSTINLKEKRTVFYEQIFMLHKTNRKDFYTSYNYYQQHPDLQKILYDSLAQSLKPKVVNKPPVKSLQ